MPADMNWCGVLEHHAQRTPGKPLCVHGGKPVTYLQMFDNARSLGLPSEA